MAFPLCSGRRSGPRLTTSDKRTSRHGVDVSRMEAQGPPSYSVTSSAVVESTTESQRSQRDEGYDFFNASIAAVMRVFCAGSVVMFNALV